MDLNAIKEALRGRYRIERELGRGGMGVVYQAYQDSQQRRVALKLVSTALVDDLEWAERLTQEARLAARISHPNVVRVYELERLGDDWAMITFELVTGQSLRALMDAEAPFTPQRVRDLGVGLASGLDAIHAAGILHRDLKPENVLLASNESLSEYEPKITDLGIAKDTAGDKVRTKTGIMLGTPPYMAPEHIVGTGNYTGAVDVYALGCMLFEMVTGRLPFDAPHVAQLLAAHVNEPPPRISDLRGGLPVELSNLIDACLRKEPDQRPTAAQLVDLLASPGAISAPPQAEPRPEVAAPKGLDGAPNRTGSTSAIHRAVPRVTQASGVSGTSRTVPVKQSIVRETRTQVEPAGRAWNRRMAALVVGIVSACAVAAAVRLQPAAPRGRIAFPQLTLGRAAAKYGALKEAARKASLEQLSRLMADPLTADLNAVLKRRHARRLGLASGEDPIAVFFRNADHAVVMRDHTLRSSELARSVSERHAATELSMDEQRLVTDAFVARVEYERFWALLRDDADLLEMTAGAVSRWAGITARLGRKTPKLHSQGQREIRAEYFHLESPPVDAALRGIFRELDLADRQPLPEFEKFRSCWRGLSLLFDVVEVDAAKSSELAPFFKRVRPSDELLARSPEAAALMAAIEDSRGPNHSYANIQIRFRESMPRPPAGQVIPPLWQHITDRAVQLSFPFSRL